MVMGASEACARVRRLARLESQHDVKISDAVAWQPGSVMVMVYAPAHELELWTSRVVFALLDPLLEFGVAQFEIAKTVSRSIPTPLIAQVSEVWDWLMVGGAEPQDADVVALFDSGELTEQIRLELHPDPASPRAPYPARGPVMKLSWDEYEAQVVRRGLVRRSSYTLWDDVCTVEEARAALSTINCAPEGYQVGGRDDLWVLDDHGYPQAVISWVQHRWFHKPNGFQPQRENFLAKIASRRYDPELGHVKLQSRPVTLEPMKLGPRPRRHLEPGDKLVMIDSSVMWSSMRHGFPQDTLIVFHTALAMDVIFAEYDRDFDPIHKLGNPKGPFFDGLLVDSDLPEEPIAPDHEDLKFALRLMIKEGRRAVRQGKERRLSRADAISVAMAVRLRVPLLTRVPEVYEGLSEDPRLVIQEWAI